MTMDLSGSAFFLSYLKALSNKQLQALRDYQRMRLSGEPDKETITDALGKNKMIIDEIRSRNGTSVALSAKR